MNASSKERAEGLFYEAMELPAEKRELFLDRMCVEDGNLRAEVDALLRAYDGAGGFLSADATTFVDAEPEFSRPKSEDAGERIGQYRLVEQIGEGGFGTVWVAEQEKPVRRNVALKIIKLGMDTREVVARFEQERQALAMMEHPNIAKVLDAGATPTGRPYFVMELVRGTRITGYCDEETLSTAERLQLFVQVCSAVQHAHQKGIIHRDLKPSNILVTLQDGVPVPKVIDFGVAKATQQQRLTELTVYTQFEQMIGTPLYMAPEQAERSGLDIDTRSDIYSLGVLLYELLTGRTPFDPEQLLKAGFDEMRRVIREEVPQKPSTFIKTLAADTRSTVAQHRQADGGKFLAQIQGDLDWIVMKALEKDRNRRYETASSFAKDIERHLNSEPVQARPPSAGYKFRRFVRRNRVLVGAGAGIAAAIIAGSSVSVWQAMRAHRGEVAAKREADRALAAEAAQKKESERALIEAQKSRQVADFFTEMLGGIQSSVALGLDTTLLRGVLEETVPRIGSDLGDKPEVEVELREIVGNIYADLGDYPMAERMHRKALEIKERVYGKEHLEVSRALLLLSSSLWLQEKTEEAEAASRRALEIRRSHLGTDHLEVAEALSYLAICLRKEGNFVEAERTAREALAIARQHGGDDYLITNTLFVLAQAVGHQGRASESEEFHREILAIRRARAGDEHPVVAESLLNLSQALRQQEKFAEAETLNREAIGIQRNLNRGAHPSLGYALKNLGELLVLQHKFAEAEAPFREAVAVFQKWSGNEQQTADAIYRLSVVLQEQRKDDQAEVVLRGLLTVQQERSGEGDQGLATTRRLLSTLLERRGNYPEAESLRRSVMENVQKSVPNDAERMEGSMAELAENLYRQQRFEEAEPLYRQIVESRASRLPVNASELLLAISSLARQLADRALIEHTSMLTTVGKASRDSGYLAAADQVRSRAHEAERLLRGVLDARTAAGGGKATWRIMDVSSRLGGAIAAVAFVDTTLAKDERDRKLTEAETLLVTSAEELQSEAKVERKYRRDALDRVVRFYTAWKKPKKAAQWKQRLQEFDSDHAEPASVVNEKIEQAGAAKAQIRVR